MKTIVNKPNMVQLMREIREQFSLEIQHMSLEEQKTYMKKFVAAQKKKRRTIIKTEMSN